MNVINDAERRLCASSEAIEGRLNGLDADVIEEIAKRERKQEFLNNNANALVYIEKLPCIIEIPFLLDGKNGSDRNLC